MSKISFNLFLFVILVVPSIEAQLFWQISGNGVTEKSYLFGTHHLIEKEQINHFDQLLETLKKVDVVVGEMDMSNIFEMQMEMMQGAIMKDKTMKDLLCDKDYILVDEALKSTIGTGLHELGNLKPMMLNSMYSLVKYMQHHQIKEQPEAVDLIFQKMGEKYKKKIVGLETVEQQIDLLFNSISLERQAEILVAEINDMDKSLEILDRLNNAYIAGNLSLLLALHLENEDMTPEENQLLLELRNDAWMFQLSEILPEFSCFIAVGCMHLVGESGLIRQLRDKGFIVEAIDF